MRLIPRIRTRFLAVEHGFSMIIVMGVMAASALFVAAAFAAANGDLPLTRDSQDRKQAYAAAEAGINYYQYHLNQDPDYWTRCTNVPAPNATENQPVNQKWITGTTDPRRWRKVAGTPTEYTLELMPAPGLHELRREQPEHDDRPGDGHVQDPLDRAARARAASSSAASSRQFRRRSFLDFLYFTDFETTDPINYDADDQAWAQANCGDRYRDQRDDSCREIQFAQSDADAIKGPLHTNDDILTCGTPVFGRNSADSIEFSGPAPGWRRSAACAGTPVFNGPKPRRREVADDAADQHDAADRRGDRRPCLPGHDQDPLQQLDEQHDRHQRAGQQRQPADARPPGQRRDLRGQPLRRLRHADRRRTTRPTASRAPAATSTSAAPTRPA